MQEQDPDTGVSLRSYSYGQGPLELEAEGTTITYHEDSLGSIVALTNSEGDRVASYRYEPYGEGFSTEESPSAPEAESNPLRFSGQYLDQDSGLYYMRARSYDPDTGRFLQQDPLSESVQAAAVSGS